jgi:hypothetical protein
MKRRTFLFFAVAGAAVIAIPFAACRPYSSSLAKTLGQPDFLTHICDDKTIRGIGAAYCTRTPEEAEQNKLISLLLASPGCSQRQYDSAADYSRLIQLLDNAVRDDYTAGKVLTINGWVLSLTEARQCALYSFSK